MGSCRSASIWRQEQTFYIRPVLLIRSPLRVSRSHVVLRLPSSRSTRPSWHSPAATRSNSGLMCSTSTPIEPSFPASIARRIISRRCVRVRSDQVSVTRPPNSRQARHSKRPAVPLRERPRTRRRQHRDPQATPSRLSHPRDSRQPSKQPRDRGSLFLPPYIPIRAQRSGEW